MQVSEIWGHSWEVLNTDLTQREEICSFADIKKAIEIYA